MSLMDLFKGGEYRTTILNQATVIDQQKEQLRQLGEERDALKRQLSDLGGLSLIEVQQRIQAAKVEQAEWQAGIEKKTQERTVLDAEIAQRRKELLVLDEALMLESFALYTPKYALTTSEAYKTKLEEIRQEQKDLIKDERAAMGSQTWAVNNSEAEGRKLVKDMVKLVLRAFNNECDYCVDNVKFNSVEAHEKRINQSFEALNKLGRVMQVSINDRYRRLKLEELHLAHEYQVKKQEEKEEQKRIREELREQQKLEQEIKTAREKIEKERAHFKAALKDIEARIAKAGAEVPAELAAKKEELMGQLATLDGEEKLIDYREKNAKAGYVYVISNIGSFGEGVYKIGMTRRLEPMDRIDELGDASVPFTFDVHALVFSENAPALEAKLHEHFHAQRVNKLNDRKEFFRCDINEIERVIKEGYDKALDMVKEAPAEQYRESVRL